MKAFKTLKEKLINSPILQNSNFEKEFTITKYSRNFTLGAVLSQAEINKDLQIAYASRTLNQHKEKLLLQ